MSEKAYSGQRLQAIETAGSLFNKMVETLGLTIVKEGLEDKSEKKSLLTRFVMMP